MDGLGSSIGFGETSLLSTIWNDFTGNTAQQKEFEQQEYLMDKQNEYDKMENQVQRVLDAGLNPNAMFGPQSNNTSASPSQVASNTQGVANAVKSLADVGLSAVSGVTAPSSIEKNLADALHARELGVSEETFRNDRLKQIQAAWACDDVQARMNEILLNNIGEEQMARINHMNAQSDLFAQQILLYQQQIAEMEKNIELMDSQMEVNESIITLNGSQVKVNAKVAAQYELENFKLQWRNEIIQRIGGDPNSPLEQQLFTIANKYGVGSIPYQSALTSATDSYNSRFNAEFELWKQQQQILYDNAIDQLNEYMKKELGNKYKGLPADVVNAVGKGFGAGLGAVVGSKIGGAIPATPSMSFVSSCTQ